MLAVGLGAAVTGARLQLWHLWPAFWKATCDYNRQVHEAGILLTPVCREETGAQGSVCAGLQVLLPLPRPDVVVIACLPAAAEELLFRGALIPATLPDWCDAVLRASLPVKRGSTSICA